MKYSRQDDSELGKVWASRGSGSASHVPWLKYTRKIFEAHLFAQNLGLHGWLRTMMLD